MSRWWGPDFEFSTSFTLEAPREQVHGVLVDLEHYSEWWPQVRAVAKIDDDHAYVVSRSALPYDLDLVLTARSRELDVLEVGIDGPIRGTARFGLRSLSEQVTDVRFEQRVRAVAPAFVVASYAAKPVLVWNHQRMMRGLVAGVGQSSAASAAS